MPSYRPKSVSVNASVMEGGIIEILTEANLEKWSMTLFKGKVNNPQGSALTNVAIFITAGNYEVSNFNPIFLLGTVFTDIKGEYAISLPLLSQNPIPLSYNFEAYTPLG